MDKKEESDVKFSEKFSLKFRKTIIVSKLFTILIVLVLIAAFIGLNYWVNLLELPEIDVTANKIYTLSDSSKDALKSIDQDIKIYIFGIEEDDSVVGLIKQYCAVNDKITYEMLSSESNLAKVQEFELEDGYSIIVIESGESKKIIDASSEFHTYDYTTYAEVDVTEQTLTNSILGLSTENKPKVYFVEGHEEFSIGTEEGSQAELGVLATYLKNEAFEVSSLNLTSAGNVPEDCDVLAIMSPSADFLENEAQAVIDYINKGGNIFLTQDVLSQGSQFTNLQKILDVYGVSIENGYVLETDSNHTVSNYPYVFKPQIASSNEITADINSDSFMWLAYAEKLNFKSEEELDALNVTYEELLGTTDSALFVTDFSSDATVAAQSAESGHATIAALLTKTISDGKEDENPEPVEPTKQITDENVGTVQAEDINMQSSEVIGTEDVLQEDGEEIEDEEEFNEEEYDEDYDNEETTDEHAIQSKLIIVANGRFITDYVVSELSNQYPISYLGANKDFAINSIASLADKEQGLTLRKDMAGTSYVFTASETQNRVVLAIIFIVPIVIIILGIIIWRHRKKRK